MMKNMGGDANKAPYPQKTLSEIKNKASTFFLIMGSIIAIMYEQNQ
ncbi:MAG: hypothetical protein RR365_01190 [Bacteroides sp.]